MNPFVCHSLDPGCGHHQNLRVFRIREVFKITIEEAGWYMDPGPPSWDPAAETFSFFLRKQGHDSVLCFIAINVLENAVQSGDLSEPALTQIFDAYRQLIELRAAQQVNAGQLNPNGFVLLHAEDI